MKTYQILLSVCLLTGSMTSMGYAASNSEAEEVAATYQTPPVSESQFRRIDYKGIGLEVPAACSVSNDSHLLIHHPDGTYGVSMTYTEAPGTNQKRVYNLVGGLAKSLQMKEARLQKVKINGIKGAIATGVIDNKDATIVMLPKGGKEITAIVMAHPQRSEWTKQLLRTLAR